MPDVREVFAASVRREREARGWTGGELAQRSGVTQPTISSIEHSRFGTTLDVAAKLARAFGVTIGALVDAGEQIAREELEA
jgi:transcriptional regulator with XRE-family HTH domain